MSKVSFSKPGVPVDATEPNTPEMETPTPCDENGNPTCTDVAAPAPAFPYNEDNIGFADIKFPKLKVVQKSSSLAVAFALGEIVLKDQIAIYTPPVMRDGSLIKTGSEPVTIVFIGFRKDRYAEKVPYGTDQQGLLCYSLTEVAKANGTLNQREHKAKLAAKMPSREFQTLATGLFLVRKPKDVNDADRILFPFVHEGEQYALATLDMKGGLFTECASVFRQEKQAGYLTAGGYPSFLHTVSTKLKTYATGNTSYVTVLKAVSRTPESLAAFIKQITGS